MERFEMARQGLVVNNTTGPFCFYADAQATIAALQARVKDLKEWLAAYKQSIELAQSSLTQRTAELEAANQRVMDERNLSNSWMKKHDELLAKVHKSGQFGAVVVQDVLKERDTLQAELERVRERVGQRGLEVVMIGKVGHYVSTAVKEELERVRALIKALPKVEGEIVAQAGYVKDRKKVYACFGSVVDMTAYAALLQHRQGMEG